MKYYRIEVKLLGLLTIATEYAFARSKQDVLNNLNQIGTWYISLNVEEIQHNENT